ncbi:histidine kinase CKI1-like [Syzygium oleosum]|uniref:histidine kinase CKI1-like n=1 Tax=Syzygium oleosum TaxID=219896 RepID=UPI0024B87BBA|nr:histidine kinase CKI1-like [Syzygium oleosum]
MCYYVNFSPFIFQVLSSLTVKRWCLMTEQTQQKVDCEARESISKSLTEIEKIATLLPPLDLSTTNLARVIGSYLGGSELSFQSIQIKVAPVLFLALSTIPYLSRVSYIGADGLLLSYHGDNDHAFATYSNASSSSVWYTQPVDRRTGQPFGEAVTTQSMISVNDSWFQEALNDARGYPLLGNAWNKNQDLLILYITP